MYTRHFALYTVPLSVQCAIQGRDLTVYSTVHNKSNLCNLYFQSLDDVCLDCKLHGNSKESPTNLGKGYRHLILNKRFSVLCLFVCHAQGTPPGFLHVVDRRYLVEDLSPQLEKTLWLPIFLNIFKI